MKTDGTLEGRTSAGEFDSSQAAEAVADAGDAGGIRAVVGQQHLQAGLQAGAQQVAILLVLARLLAGRRRLRPHALAVHIRHQDIVAEAGEFAGALFFVVADAGPLMDDEHGGATAVTGVIKGLPTLAEHLTRLVLDRAFDDAGGGGQGKQAGQKQADHGRKLAPSRPARKAGLPLQLASAVVCQMLKPMPPPEPDDCRRRNRWRLRLLVLPSVAVLGLALGGEPRLAGGLFVAVGCMLMLGTLRPSSRLFGAHQRELSPAQAARGEVWLTFDDGPDPLTTPILLDCLACHGVHAGFFLIGEKAHRHPELVRAIAAAGHLIGNHSQTHAAGRFWGLPPAAMWREIAGCQQTLTHLLGSPPTLFRPPVGHHNPFVWPPLQALGLKMVLWNCRGFDAVLRDPVRVHRCLEAGLKPGAIVLLHEGRADAGELLRKVLQTLAERGLRPALPDFPRHQKHDNH